MTLYKYDIIRRCGGALNTEPQRSVWYACVRHTQWNHYTTVVVVVVVVVVGGGGGGASP